jgi:ferredoxin-type protein NapH
MSNYKPLMLTMKPRQRFRRLLIYISLLAFPLTMFYFSPAMIFKGMRQGIVPGSLITFILLFLTAVVVGRAFCAWACPVAGLCEATFAVNNNPARRGWRDLIKWFIWAPWLAAVAAVAILVGGGLHSIDPFLGTYKGISVHAPVFFIFYYLVLGIILILSLIFGRRAFCHYLCWMAPFTILGRKVRNLLKTPALQLIADASLCDVCKRCDKTCPMSLDVMNRVMAEDMEHNECILCGACVDVCHHNAVRFSLGVPRRRSIK